MSFLAEPLSIVNGTLVGNHWPKLYSDFQVLTFSQQEKECAAETLYESMIVVRKSKASPDKG